MDCSKLTLNLISRTGLALGTLTVFYLGTYSRYLSLVFLLLSKENPRESFSHKFTEHSKIQITSSIRIMTNNTEKKLIAIMGATGAQGGATIKAFNGLNAAEKDLYELRAITRDPESDKAKAIAPLVKEVVKADGDSLEEMTKAFEGCYGAFIVTNFWQGTSSFLLTKILFLIFQNGSLTSILKKN